MTLLWVLDLEGYDARGGNAEVFSTLEAAQAAAGDRKWHVSEFRNRIEYTEDVGGSLADVYAIYPVILDKPDPGPDDWPEDMRKQAAEVRAEKERRDAEARAKWQREHSVVRTSNIWRRT